MKKIEDWPLNILGYAAAVIDQSTFVMQKFKRDNRYMIQLHGEGFSPACYEFMNYYFNIPISSNKGRLKRTRFFVSSARCHDVLKAVYPYLIHKRILAKLFLEFIETVGPKGKHIDDAVHSQRDLIYKDFKKEQESILNANHKFLMRIKKKDSLSNNTECSSIEDDIIESLF